MGKFKVPLHDMKAYGTVDVKFYEFLTSTLESGE
jgi:hypothetical protein